MLRTEFLNSYAEAVTARVTVSRDGSGDKLNRVFTKRRRVTSTTSFTFNTALPPCKDPVRWMVGCTHDMKKTFTRNLTLSDIHSNFLAFTTEKVNVYS